MTENRKIALVTGGSRGIGRAVVERLGATGATVVVNYLANSGAAAEVVDAVERSGGRALAVQADVSDLQQLRHLFDVAEQHFGRLDIVVANAGTARFARVADSTDGDFETLFAANARAGFFTLREAANRVADGGRVVVVSSGVTRTHGVGSGVYGASKAAVEQLVRVMAREIGPRQVTVNSVLPGATDTDAFTANITEEGVAQLVAATPLGRVGEPSDIADVVAFLASDTGRWITGQTISAGGGAF